MYKKKKFRAQGVLRLFKSRDFVGFHVSCAEDEGAGMVAGERGGLVVGIDGESLGVPRLALPLPVLAELVRLTRTRSSLSRDGDGELRCDAISSFDRRTSSRFRILTRTKS